MDSEVDLRVIATTLADVAQTLAAGQENKAGALQHVLSLLSRLVPYDRCALQELTHPPGMFVFPPAPLAESALLAQRLERLGRQLDEDDGALFQPEPAHAGHVQLAVPVVGLSQVLGMLLVERQGEPYQENVLRLLSVVASQIGAYLVTLQLRDEEVKRAQQLGVALQRLEEMDRRKDDFLAMLGHELRNPLGAINNALHLIDGRGAQQDEWVHRYHRVIDRQIGHLSRIVDDLLDASRVRLGKIVLERRPVDLRSVVERWREAFGKMQNVLTHELVYELPAQAVPVAGDPVRLEQILGNLMTNALKYTPQGGRVQVTVGTEGGEALLGVRDNGVGIGPDLLPRVFDLFTQADESLARSQGGLGLGLSLVRSLVELHQGKISVESKLGEGSNFIMRLPLAAPGAEQAAAAVPGDGAGQASSLHILVIEDGEDARDVLCAMLDQWGHSVESRGDGLEGLSRALTHPPEVALIDIGLPGLDGFEVARRIREQASGKKMLLIAMTGYGQPETRRRALDAGFDFCMVKPFDPDELKDLLSRPRRV